MLEIFFKRTGDFWIDQGITSIWYKLATKPKKTGDSYVSDVKRHGRYDKDVVVLTATLSPYQLSLKSENDENIEKEFKKICNILYQEYIGKASTGRNWWQGISNFFFKQTKPELFFKTPEQTVIEQKGKWTNGNCDFCRRDGTVRNLGTTEHPLVVTRSKFSSFYSELSGDVKICNYCAFVTKFVPSRLFFNTNGNKILAMIFESSDLVSLNNLYIELAPLLATTTKFRNFLDILTWTQHPSESFLSFLCSVKTEFDKSRILKDSLEKLENNKAHIIEGTRGQGLIIDNYIIIPNLFKTYKFIRQCDWKSKSGKWHNSLINTAKYLMVKTSKGMDTNLREVFCHRIFYSYDIADILLEFLMDNALGINRSGSSMSPDFIAINIKSFITQYETTMMRMNNYQISLSKDIGGMIGDLASKTGNKSLLYSLRSARNLDNLISFIHETLSSYLDMIRPNKNQIDNFLQEADNSNWATYKSLIGIYAVLTYLEKTKMVEVKAK